MLLQHLLLLFSSCSVTSSSTSSIFWSSSPSKLVSCSRDRVPEVHAAVITVYKRVAFREVCQVSCRELCQVSSHLSETNYFAVACLTRFLDVHSSVLQLNCVLCRFPYQPVFGYQSCERLLNWTHVKIPHCITPS